MIIENERDSPHTFIVEDELSGKTRLLRTTLNSIEDILDLAPLIESLFPDMANREVLAYSFSADCYIPIGQ